MPYCPKCGVEVETNHCPLCNYKINRDIHTKPFSHTVDIEKKKIEISTKDKKRIFNASGLFFAILISSITLTTDLLLDKKADWSIYPILVVSTMALMTTASLYIKGIFKGVVIILLLLLMLFALDYQIPAKNFFLEISLPITSITAVISFIIIIIIKNSKKVGVNIPGYILIGISILNISIDLLIQNFRYGIPMITWSVITSVSIIPIAIFLLYIHYVLSKKVDLTKVFHT